MQNGINVSVQSFSRKESIFISFHFMKKAVVHFNVMLNAAQLGLTSYSERKW